MLTKVSVALATYNGEHFIQEQLNSYARQTHLPAELVVADDCSTDRTVDIVEEFARCAPFPVRIFRNRENLGYRDNFIRAANLCTSKYVAYSDQDDVWLPEKLQRCMQRIADDGSVFAIHGAYVTDAGLRTTCMLEQGITRDSVIPPLGIQPMPGVFGFTMVFERRLLSLVPKEFWPHQPFVELRRGVSHDLWTYVLGSVFGSISHIAAPLAFYRQHGANAFGVAELPWRWRLFEKYTIPLSHYRWRRDFSEECAHALGRAAPSLKGPDRRMAEAGAIRYRDLAAAITTRIELYESDSLTQRWRIFRTLREMGTYGRILSKSSEFRDFASGVLQLHIDET